MAETNVGDLHRVGNKNVENLRLKPKEKTLEPPGISFLQASSPTEAARQLRQAFPAAIELHRAAQVMSSTTIEKVRSAGFDIFPNPTRKFPNHVRIIHKDGISGFVDANLALLSAVLSESSGHVS